MWELEMGQSELGESEVGESEMRKSEIQKLKMMHIKVFQRQKRWSPVVYGKAFELFSYALRYWTYHENICHRNERPPVDLIDFSGRTFDRFLWSYICLGDEFLDLSLIGSLLHVAAWYGWQALADEILSRYSHHDMELSWRPDGCESPWFLAVKRGHLEMVKILMQRLHLDVNGQKGLPYDEHELPLNHAITSRNLELVKFLMKIPGMRINIEDECRKTPLICAIITFFYALRADRLKALQVFKLVLSHIDIDVRKTNEDRPSPLVIAACMGEAETIEQIWHSERIYASERTSFKNQRESLGIQSMSALLIQNGEPQSEQNHTCMKALQEELSRPDVNVNGWIKLPTFAFISGEEVLTPLMTAIRCHNYWVIESLMNCPKVDPSALEFALLQEEYKSAAILIASTRVTRDVSVRSVLTMWKYLIEFQQELALQLLTGLPAVMIDITENEKVQLVQIFEVGKGFERQTRFRTFCKQLAASDPEVCWKAPENLALSDEERCHHLQRMAQVFLDFDKRSYTSYT